MTTKDHLARHDREIAAIRSLILQGMRMIVTSQKEMRELRASQRETDRELKALIRSVENHACPGSGWIVVSATA